LELFLVKITREDLPLITLLLQVAVELEKMVLAAAVLVDFAQQSQQLVAVVLWRRL
jgi:hypothetical protein